MIETEQAELAIYREIEQLLKTAKDSILTDVIPDTCNCSSRKDKTSISMS